MNVMVSLSNTPMAHPPRSNPFLRSSSDAPPFPCITPSTVTCVMVVSFMGLSFLSWGSVSFDRTEAWISSLERGACCKSLCLLLAHGPHVGDVVLLNGHREHRRALFRVRAAAAEGLQRRLRLPEPPPWASFENTRAHARVWTPEVGLGPIAGTLGAPDRTGLVTRGDSAP